VSAPFFGVLIPVGMAAIVLSSKAPGGITYQMT